MQDWPRQSWLDAETATVAREKAAMFEVAPDLAWLNDHPAGGWEGIAPTWPFPRAAPAGLDTFLAGRRFRLVVEYSQAYPMVEPKLWPYDPVPDLMVRTRHDWHVNGDGSLCLLRGAIDWDGTGAAADLVVKAASWFIEYLLMDAGAITEMTLHGIVSDDVHDHLLVVAAPIIIESER